MPDERLEEIEQRNRLAGLADVTYLLHRLKIAEAVIQREKVALERMEAELKRVEQTQDFGAMSINGALIEIAREHGGVVVTREAIATLTKAGVFSTKGEANDNIHGTIRRSKDFKWQRRGVYRLVNRYIA